MRIEITLRRIAAAARPPLFAVALVAALVGMAASGCVSAGVSVGVRSGPLVVDLGYFHDELSPFGDWVWGAEWGWFWRPWGVGTGWVPYSYGRWIYTDWGWYWDSYWDWGWAPFHYGRWRCDPIHGWVWLPGRTWAPSWVAWRHRPGWIGWAPLAPATGWDAGVEIALDGGEPEVAAWSFVPDDRLLDPRLERRIALRARNATLIEATQLALRFERHDGHARERGLAPEIVEHSTGRVIERRRIEDTAPSAARRLDKVTREAVRPYRPTVQAAPARPAPATVAPPAAPDARSRARVESWAREEQRRLDRAQQQERRRPPTGVSDGELARRQEAERRALRNEVERRQKWSAPASPKAQPKPKPKPPRSKPPGGEGG